MMLDIKNMLNDITIEEKRNVDISINKQSDNIVSIIEHLYYNISRLICDIDVHNVCVVSSIPTRCIKIELCPDSSNSYIWIFKILYNVQHNSYDCISTNKSGGTYGFYACSEEQLEEAVSKKLYECSGFRRIISSLMKIASLHKDDISEVLDVEAKDASIDGIYDEKDYGRFSKQEGVK